MSADRLTTHYDSQHRTEIGVDKEASVLLARWLPTVGAMPQLIGARHHEAAIRELVAWYERVFQDTDYCAAAPIDGLDALIDELVHVTVPSHDHVELAKGRWAIHVAEELVSWRRRLRDKDTESTPAGPATDRLELAIEGARRHIAGCQTTL